MLCICENTASSSSLCIGWLTTDSWGCYETNWQPPSWTFYPSVLYNIHYLGDPTVVFYLGCASHTVVKTHSSCWCFCDSVSDSMGSHSVSKTACWGDRHSKRLDAADLRKGERFSCFGLLTVYITRWLRQFDYRADIIAFGTDVCLVYSHISSQIISLFFYIYIWWQIWCWWMILSDSCLGRDVLSTAEAQGLKILHMRVVGLTLVDIFCRSVCSAFHQRI